MVNRNIQHPQDWHDAKNELEKLRYPYRLMAIAQRPTSGNELEKWRKQNSYFHRAICPTYAELSGLDEHEAKRDLQIRYACVIESADSFEVESIGGMSNERLGKFIQDCDRFLVMEYGHTADELLSLNKIGKTKTIKK
jgi:hypothetical protein